MDAVATAGSALGTRPAQDRFAARVLFFIEHLGGAILAVDVAVVFLSVVFRYFLHAPFDWAEEVAAGLMTTMVFLGAGSVLARSQHIGIEVLVLMLPPRGRAIAAAAAAWITLAVSATLLVSSAQLFEDTAGQLTPTGLPQWIFLLPVLLGGFVMAAFALGNVLKVPAGPRWTALVPLLALGAAITGWNTLLPQFALAPIHLLTLAAVGGLLIGVPIAFALAFRGDGLFPGRSLAADADLGSAGRLRRQPFRAARHPLLRARRADDGEQRHVRAPHRAAAADDGAAQGRHEPDRHHRDRAVLGRLRLQARRYCGGRRRHHAGDPQDRAGRERDRGPARLHGGDGRDHSPLRQPDHLRLRLEHLDRRTVHGGPRSGRADGGGAGRRRRDPRHPASMSRRSSSAAPKGRCCR